MICFKIALFQYSPNNFESYLICKENPITFVVRNIFVKFVFTSFVSSMSSVHVSPMSVIHSSSSILCCPCHCYVRQVQFFVFCPSHCYVCQVQFVCCPCHWHVRQVQFIYYQYQKQVRPIPVLKNQNLEWILSKHNGHLAFLHNVSQPLFVAHFLG